MLKINKKIIAFLVLLAILTTGLEPALAKKKKGSWQDEGISFYAAEAGTAGSVPVYRFFSKKQGDHYFSLNSTAPKKYVAEGVAFYAFSYQAEGTLPVFQFYSSKNGDHYYEQANSQPPTPKKYKPEGIAFYAYPSQVTGASPVYRLYHTGIKDHFYTSSAVEKNSLLVSALGPDISVGLWTYTNDDLRSSHFTIEANKAYNIKDKNGSVISQIPGGTKTYVRYDADGNFIAYNSISDTIVNTKVQFDAADGDNLSMIFDVHRPNSDYNQYRGTIRLHHTDSDNNWVINTLPLEQYVWGDGETSGTGDFDHTKVMTTIFRTYGYWYIKYATKYSAYGFKIRSDSGSQIYRGYEWERDHPNIRKAAEATDGAIVTYNGDVALTPYCSWSDGRTRSFKERWGSDDYPWCKSVSDPYGKHPTMSTSELEAAGNHMVGLIGNGSVKLAADYDWSWDRILKYYYSGIRLTKSY